jgi:hypothetical protein
VVGAASVHHLCKSIVMENTRAHASGVWVVGAAAAAAALTDGCTAAAAALLASAQQPPRLPPLHQQRAKGHGGLGTACCAAACWSLPFTCAAFSFPLAVTDCSDPNNSKYYLVVVQVLVPPGTALHGSWLRSACRRPWPHPSRRSLGRASPLPCPPAATPPPCLSTPPA